MATKLHDCNLFSDFVLLTSEVLGDGQVRPRARDPLPLELVEAVRARIVARHDFDSLREEEKVYDIFQQWERKKKVGRGIKRKKIKTYDLDIVLSEIPAFVNGAVLTFSYGRPAEVVV